MWQSITARRSLSKADVFHISWSLLSPSNNQKKNINTSINGVWFYDHSDYNIGYIGYDMFYPPIIMIISPIKNS